MHIKATDLLIFPIECILTQKDYAGYGLCTRGSSSLSGRRMHQIFCTLSACLCVLFILPHQVTSDVSNYLFWLPWSCHDYIYHLHHSVHTQREQDFFFYKRPRLRNWLDLRNSWAVPAAVTSLVFTQSPGGLAGFWKWNSVHLMLMRSTWW